MSGKRRSETANLGKWACFKIRLESRLCRLICEAFGLPGSRPLTKAGALPHIRRRSQIGTVGISTSPGPCVRFCAGIGSGADDAGFEIDHDRGKRTIGPWAGNPQLVTARD